MRVWVFVPLLFVGACSGKAERLQSTEAPLGAECTAYVSVYRSCMEQMASDDVLRARVSALKASLRQRAQTTSAADMKHFCEQATSQTRAACQ